MLGTVWTMLKETVYEFVEDSAFSRGAAISYYTLFSLAPILVIAIAIAGSVFGEDAARGALVGQLRGLMGQQGADFVQSMVQGASSRHTGTVATIGGLVLLVVTSTGVFAELQADLNAIWKAQSSSTLSAMLKTRALSLGLVAALGFLLLVSLLISTALSALGTYLNRLDPNTAGLFQIVDFVVSFLLIAVMFAAIYKVLPDKTLSWRDVGVGAVVTAFLFTIGKVLIGLYIGNSAIASTYGAAGTALVLLLWIYWSALIFLLGAEFTKVTTRHLGSPIAPPAASTSPVAQLAPVLRQPPARQVTLRRPFGVSDVIALGVLAAAWLRRRERP